MLVDAAAKALKNRNFAPETSLRRTSDLVGPVGAFLFDQNFAHQPITTLQIVLSFLWFGNDVSAPYLLNVMYIFIFLYSISRALREFGSFPTMVFSLMAISVPLVFFFASHLKTDFLMGVLFFMLVVELFILDGDRLARLVRASIIGCGVVLCKPTAFYIPGLLCFVFGIHLIHDMILGKIEPNLFDYFLHSGSALCIDIRTSFYLFRNIHQRSAFTALD